MSNVKCFLGYPEHNYPQCIFKNYFGRDYYLDSISYWNEDYNKKYLSLNELKIPRSIHYVWATTSKDRREIGNEETNRAVNNAKLLNNSGQEQWKHYLWINNPLYLLKTVTLFKDSKFEVLTFNDLPTYYLFEERVEATIDSRMFGVLSDILRAIIVYDKGGIYADFDFVFSSNPSLLHYTFNFYGGYEKVDWGSAIASGFFASSSKHPILKYDLHIIAGHMNMIKNYYNYMPESVNCISASILGAGPSSVTMGFYLGKNVDDNIDILFPSDITSDYSNRILPLNINGYYHEIKPIGYQTFKTGLWKGYISNNECNLAWKRIASPEDGKIKYGFKRDSILSNIIDSIKKVFIDTNSLNKIDNIGNYKMSCHPNLFKTTSAANDCIFKTLFNVEYYGNVESEISDIINHKTFILKETITIPYNVNYIWVTKIDNPKNYPDNFRYTVLQNIKKLGLMWNTNIWTNYITSNMRLYCDNNSVNINIISKRNLPYYSYFEQYLEYKLKDGLFIFAVDVIRILILKHRGGIVTDGDFTFKNDPYILHNTVDYYLSISLGHTITGSYMASTVNHKVNDKTLEIMLDNFRITSDLNHKVYTYLPETLSCYGAVEYLLQGSLTLGLYSEYINTNTIVLPFEVMNGVKSMFSKTIEDNLILKINRSGSDYLYNLNNIGDQLFSGTWRSNCNDNNDIDIKVQNYNLENGSKVIDGLEIYAPFVVTESINTVLTSLGSLLWPAINESFLIEETQFVDYLQDNNLYTIQETFSLPV